jgi:hypothetical protein
MILVAGLTLGATLPLCGEVALTPQQGILVLNNGHVLEGQISSVGDYFIVTLGQQGEVRLKATSVEMICPTLEDAYYRKRDNLPPVDIAAHLQLADWCLQQNLLPRAADQLLAVHALDPRHPRLAKLERRLLNLARPTTKAAEPTSAIGGEEPTLEESPETESLADASVEEFTENVQPVLLNRCATNACHGLRSGQSFQLIRPARGQSLAPRQTHQNLRSALDLVDREQPDRSPLLTVPQRPHGGQEEPVFGPQEADQVLQLQVWVKTLTAAHEPPPAANSISLPFSEANPASRTGSENETSMAGFADAAVYHADEGRVAPSDVPHFPRQEPPATISRDPYDPEVFNRLFLPAGQTEYPPPRLLPPPDGAAQRNPRPPERGPRHEYRVGS